MVKKIPCQTKTKTEIEQVKVKIIKAPLVDTKELRAVIYARARALVL